MLHKVIELIKQDEELNGLLYAAFKWRENPLMCAEQIQALAAVIWDKYNIDIEIYT